MPSLCPAARAYQRRGICPAGLVPSLRACTLRARHGIRSPCLPSALRPAPAEGGASALPGLCRVCRRRGICPAGPVPRLRACTLRARHGIRSPSSLYPAGCVRQAETLYHITRKRGTAAPGTLHIPCLHFFQMRARPYIDGTCACRGHTSAHSLLFSFPSIPPVPAASPCKMLPRRIGAQASGLSELHTPRQGRRPTEYDFPFPF